MVKENASQHVYSEEQVIHMYPRHSLEEIARYFGVPPSKVRTDLLKHDIPMAPPGRRQVHEVPTKAFLEDMIGPRGLSQGQAAYECGVSKHTFQNWLKERGVTSPPRRKAYEQQDL